VENQVLYLEMKKEQFRMGEAVVAMAATVPRQLQTTFSLLVRRPGAKNELAGITLAQNAS
jgi:hypothetical protein